jgi:class 3 adenylate cyclase
VALSKDTPNVPLPQGTVTFLFTDIEGSTRLLQERGDEYAELLAGHHHALRGEFARHGGVEVITQGTPSSYESLISGARERLGSVYDAERRAGAGLTLAQAVAEARRHLPLLGEATRLGSREAADLH